MSRLGRIGKSATSMASRSVAGRFPRVLEACMIAAATSVLLGSGAQAQTLTDALVSSYNSNPDLLAQRARLRQVDETVNQALAGWRPVVRGQIDRGFTHARAGIGGFSQDLKLQPRTYVLTAVQPVFRGGKTTAATLGAEADVRAERAGLMDREQTVLLGTIAAYSDVIRDDATVRLRRNNVNVLRQQLAATIARFRVGEVTNTDVAQAESRLAGAQSDLTAAEAQAAISRAAYRRVVGQTPGAQLREPPLMGTPPQTEGQAIAASVEFAPRVAAAQHRVASARYAIDNTFGDLLPTVQIQGTASRAHDRLTKGDHLYSYSMLGQVTVPVYQTGAEYSRVRAAKQAVGQRQNELDSVRRLSVESAIRALRQLEAARARAVSLGAQIRAAAAALEGVRQEAQAGVRTTLDVLNAEQEYLNAQVQLVLAQRDVIVGHYQLLAETGQLTARRLRLPVRYYDEENYYKAVRNAWFGLGN